MAPVIAPSREFVLDPIVAYDEAIPADLDFEPTRSLHVERDGLVVSVSAEAGRNQDTARECAIEEGTRRTRKAKPVCGFDETSSNEVGFESRRTTDIL